MQHAGGGKASQYFLRGFAHGESPASTYSPGWPFTAMGRATLYWR
ncbi:hypothetical protein ACMHYB_08280 [Sorangium sp. So ce1128]